MAEQTPIVTPQALIDAMQLPKRPFQSPADCVKLSRVVRAIMNRPSRDKAFIVAAEAILIVRYRSLSPPACSVSNACGHHRSVTFWNGLNNAGGRCEPFRLGWSSSRKAPS